MRNSKLIPTTASVESISYAEISLITYPFTYGPIKIKEDRRAFQRRHLRGKARIVSVKRTLPRLLPCLVQRLTKAVFGSAIVARSGVAQCAQPQPIKILDPCTRRMTAKNSAYLRSGRKGERLSDATKPTDPFPHFILSFTTSFCSIWGRETKWR